MIKTGQGSLIIGGGVILSGELNFTDGELQIASGVLAQPGRDVTIGNGSNLVTSGIVQRRVHAVGPLSRITAVGTTTIGDVTIADGFNFSGIVDVGPYVVGLVDADQAELFSALLDVGTLWSVNGISLSGQLLGHGTITGNLAMEDGSEYACELSSPGSADKVTVTGQLDLGSTGNSLMLDWLPGGNASSKFGGVYEVVQYGSLVGEFEVVDSGNIGNVYLDKIDHLTDNKITVALHELIDGDVNLDGLVDSQDFGSLKAHFGETVVVAHVIEVRMGVDHNHRQVSQPLDLRLDVADAHPGVYQSGAFGSQHEIRDHFLNMVWFQ